MSERQPMLIDIASIVGELYPDGLYANGRNAMFPGMMMQDTTRRGILGEYDEGPIY
jgi:hypothetical protein